MRTWIAFASADSKHSCASLSFHNSAATRSDYVETSNFSMYALFARTQDCFSVGAAQPATRVFAPRDPQVQQLDRAELKHNLVHKSKEPFGELRTKVFILGFSHHT